MDHFLEKDKFKTNREKRKAALLGGKAASGSKANDMPAAFPDFCF